MDKIKAYFIDLDGTFLDKGRNHASVENTEAIKSAIDKGQIVIFSTGRNMTTQTMNLIESANVKNGIFLNGAIIMANNEIIRNLVIEKQKIYNLNNFFVNNNLFVFLNSAINNRIHSGKLWMHPLFWLSKYRVWGIKKIMTHYNYDEIYKYTIFSFSRRKIVWTLEDLAKLNLDLSITTSYGDRVIEITHKDATKGKATAIMLQKLGILGSEAIHIGDSMNDLSVKDVVSKLVAMKDSTSKKFLEEVDFIGPNHKPAGVAKIILKNEWVKKS